MPEEDSMTERLRMELALLLPDLPGDQSQLRCCIESICDNDFSPAFNCLAGQLQQALHPPG